MKQLTQIGTLVLILALAGCASSNSARPPDADLHQTRGSNSVTVMVTGGEKSSGMGALRISDPDFARALSNSIARSGLFKEVVPSGGRYKLNAVIGKVEQPEMGFTTTVKMEVGYTLIDTRSGKAVWSKTVASEFTAKGSAAFEGAKRLVLAHEGAAKANIQRALTQISAVGI